MSATLSLTNHSIQRGGFILCRGIHLELSAGKICHLVGENGTGKTTLLMQLAGLLPSSLMDDDFQTINHQGKIHYCGVEGLPVQPVYVAHQVGIHSSLSVLQNFQFLLELYGIQATTEQMISALAWVALDQYAEVRCNQLSAGQVRRVNLARLKLMTPIHSKLWLLDEPFTALDRSMVASLQARLVEFCTAGGSVLMTSHQPVDVADMILNLSDFIARDAE